MKAKLVKEDRFYPDTLSFFFLPKEVFKTNVPFAPVCHMGMIGAQKQGGFNEKST